MITRRSLLLATLASAIAPRMLAAQDNAETARIEFVPHQANLLGEGRPMTTVWSPGTGRPPPVLRARQGREFRALIANRLDREVTLHWHGVRASSEMMSLKIAPGSQEDFECVFTPPDAGTFWFGPVSDVSRQREMGLYGVLVVEEAEPLLGLQEETIVVDDWLITDDGLIDPASFGNLEDAIAQGRLGNWFTMNGVFRPRIAIAKDKVTRLRFLNAANVRSMPIVFKGADPLIAALDGQPVTPRSLGAAPLLLQPGERCDVLVTEGDDDVTMALDLFEDVVELGYLRRTGESGKSNLPDNFAFPPNPISRTLSLESAKQVPLIIEGGAKGGMTGAKLNGQDLSLRELLEKGFAWAFNGVAGLGGGPWARFAEGDTVIVNVENRTAFAQPLHIHGHVWQLIERDGEALADQPWRDTASVDPGKTARLAFVADNPGTWGLNSSIAERLDSGLITSFAVDT
jgi:FtsP/CotA-like multicopper oxidase with cupredoxin domain